MTAWIKVAADLDSNPKIRKAGQIGCAVFLFALRRYGTRYDPTEKSDDGTIPIADIDPEFVSDMLMMSEDEAQDGIDAAIDAGLLRVDGDKVVIVGHKSIVWKRDATNAERQKRHRNALRNDPKNVTRNGQALVTPRSDQIREEEIRSRTDPEIPEPVSARHVVTVSNGLDGASQDDAGERFDRGPQLGDTPSTGIALNANQRPSRSMAVKVEPPIEALTLGQLLLDYVVKNTPDSRLALGAERVRESAVQSWANEIRKLHALDAVPYAAISAMIHWTQRHTWWRTVIISGDKLRSNWDQLTAQRLRPRDPKAQPSPEDLAAANEKRRAEIEREKRTILERDLAAAADRAEVGEALARINGKIPPSDNADDSSEDS